MNRKILLKIMLWCMYSQILSKPSRESLNEKAGHEFPFLVLPQSRIHNGTPAHVFVNNLRQLLFSLECQYLS